VMAMTLHVGDEAPRFSLANANAAHGPATMSFDDAKGENGTVVVFECNHCPYVVASIGRMNAMAEKCANLGIGFVGINSNDPVVYENDSFEHMVKRADDGMPYPYLHDDTQEVAHAYGAKRTPEFFLFDHDHRLVYQGRMDDSPRHPGEVTVEDLDNAIQAMLSGEAPSVAYTESIGCSVKWKA
jgi:peroxiredoxin